MSKPDLNQLNQQIDATRSALKPAGQPELTGGVVKSARFYHSSISRHNAVAFTLDDGTEVFKALRETDDLMQVASVFSTAQSVAVWYDSQKRVQQFVLSHQYD